mmetsp:Transcript_4166/g.9463  ORF Transcript_4166/g.9463 Transcript_4166/m.9463 type:complete len:207 (+) Transcript_4166:944-1564(+)
MLIGQFAMIDDGALGCSLLGRALVKLDVRLTDGLVMHTAAEVGRPVAGLAVGHDRALDLQTVEVMLAGEVRPGFLEGAGGTITVGEEDVRRVVGVRKVLEGLAAVTKFTHSHLLLEVGFEDGSRNLHHLPDLLLNCWTLHAEVDSVLIPFGRKVQDIEHDKEDILGRVLALRALALHELREHRGADDAPKPIILGAVEGGHCAVGS